MHIVAVDIVQALYIRAHVITDWVLWYSKEEVAI